MQPQWLSMNVTSKTHVRSSSGSSKLTHSWVVPSFTCRSATGQLRPELAGGEEALPELVHHHPFVGCVNAVAGQADAEKENRRVEDAAECLLGSAPPFASEQWVFAPHAGDGPAERADGRVVDGRQRGGDPWALAVDGNVDSVRHAGREPGVEGVGHLRRILIGDQSEGDLDVALGGDDRLDAGRGVAHADADDVTGRSGPDALEEGASLLAFETLHAGIALPCLLVQRQSSERRRLGVGERTY